MKKLETYIFANGCTRSYKVTMITPDLTDDELKAIKQKLSEKLYDIFVKYENVTKKC